MRNPACPLANYCDKYSKNKCQGCERAVVQTKTSGLMSKVDIDKIVDSVFHRTLLNDDAKLKVSIKNVVFNDPATIVMWSDGTKTVVKCQKNDTYSKETGLAVAIAKKALGNKGNFNEVFKKWIPDYVKDEEKEN